MRLHLFWMRFFVIGNANVYLLIVGNKNRWDENYDTEVGKIKEANIVDLITT